MANQLWQSPTSLPRPRQRRRDMLRDTIGLRNAQRAAHLGKLRGVSNGARYAVFAEELADAAGEIIRPYFRQGAQLAIRSRLCVTLQFLLPSESWHLMHTRLRNCIAGHAAKHFACENVSSAVLTAGRANNFCYAYGQLEASRLLWQVQAASGPESRLEPCYPGRSRSRRCHEKAYH